MRWQLKAFILRTLSTIPCGKTGYLAIQKVCGTTRVQPKRDLQRVSELIQLIHEAGQNVVSSRCYEIGTGWHPFAPLGFYLAGAEQIVTVDVNPWLSFTSAIQTVRSAEPHLDWFAEQSGLDAAKVRQRYQQILFSARTMPELLKSLHCQYIYPGDARQTGKPEHEFDFVISSNVLEHIPAGILGAINQESFRILKPGGLAVHRFNPGDHYANSDTSVSTVNFLQFSEQQWKKYGDGLAYHNRLRCSDFSRIFQSAGFLPLIEETRVDENALELLQQGKVSPHAAYQAYDIPDLASDYMWYVGMKPTAISTGVSVTEEIFHASQNGDAVRHSVLAGQK